MEWNVGIPSFDVFIVLKVLGIMENRNVWNAFVFDAQHSFEKQSRIKWHIAMANLLVGKLMLSRYDMLRSLMIGNNNTRASMGIAINDSILDSVDIITRRLFNVNVGILNVHAPNLGS